MSPKQETILTHTVSVVTKQNGFQSGSIYASKKYKAKQKKKFKKEVQERVTKVKNGVRN